MRLRGRGDGMGLILVGGYDVIHLSCSIWDNACVISHLLFRLELLVVGGYEV